jgi:hypothetical protein
MTMLVRSMLSRETRENLNTATLAQTATINTALLIAKIWLLGARVSEDDSKKHRAKMRAYCFLNRACELACEKQTEANQTEKKGISR